MSKRSAHGDTLSDTPTGGRNPETGCERPRALRAAGGDAGGTRIVRERPGTCGGASAILVGTDAAGFQLAAPALAPGTYDITVYAWSHRAMRWDDTRTVRVTVR